MCIYIHTTWWTTPRFDKALCNSIRWALKHRTLFKRLILSDDDTEYANKNKSQYVLGVPCKQHCQGHEVNTCSLKWLPESSLYSLPSCSWSLLWNMAPSCCLICFQIRINWNSNRTHSSQNINVRQIHFKKDCCVSDSHHTSIKLTFETQIKSAKLLYELKFQAATIIHLTVHGNNKDRFKLKNWK